MTAQQQSKARRVLRKTVALSSVIILGTAAGCTTIPRNTSPQVLRPFEPPQVRIEVPQPRPNVNADIVLRDFFAAAAHPVDDFQAMRAFMTPELAASWKPHDSARILDGVNLIAQHDEGGSRQSFVARGRSVGQFGTDGAYEPQSGDYEETVEMKLGSDGQWRISSLPDGVVMERQAFLENNVPRNVYFLDPAGNHLVTDRRWLYRGVTDGATNLLTKLKNGPSAPLRPGVTTVLKPNASIAVEAGPVSNSDGRRVEITGLGDVPEELRVMLAAQIIWTLDSADFRGPWILMADGEPLVASHDEPWTKDTDAIQLYDPNHLPADNAPLRTVDRSGIYEIADGHATPVGRGWSASGSTAVFSAAVGINPNGSELIAAVFRSAVDGRTGSYDLGESTLMLGGIQDQPVPVLTGESLTRPTWSPDAEAVWTVKDGTTVVRLVRQPTSSRIQQEEVDTSEVNHLLDGGEGTGHSSAGISEFRVDSSGTQVAMIIAGEVYIATIERHDDKPWKLTHPRALPLPENVSPVSLTWSPNQTVTVGGYSGDTPMWSAFPDGATSSVLPKLNLTPPIPVVTATSSKRYALDATGVMELISSEGQQQFWRQVPGAHGRMAPVSVE
ncbi:LpqB family beta-propeller domain-containing protein [uncultured Corynebacterium sp.]|uniref:LpqB family beta-propeller domain-containing protein n=1 Tax=uncultured Corynebacterium sp. TaxID=159447 RepID=UPI002596EB0C|nr:LpqB family beta-propeller domain-containing protein [uncultured Corynebacterium sp.]